MRAGSQSQPKDGVVTLSGFVKTYPEKHNAECAVRRVAGVRAVAEDLVVRLSPAGERTDADIARAVLSILGGNVAIPSDCIQVTVDNGGVVLDGAVEWRYQRDMAEGVIRHTPGVRVIHNRIVIKPRTSASDVKVKIEGALARQAQADANQIAVECDGDRVVLRGSVRSLAAKDAAEAAAWSAPGVTNVENDLVVSHAER